jgi:hypothetical protein
MMRQPCQALGPLIIGLVLFACGPTIFAAAPALAAPGESGTKTPGRGRSNPALQAPRAVMDLSPAYVAIESGGNWMAYAEQDSIMRWHFVVKGRRTAPYYAIASPAFSPDGRHFAFCAKIRTAWSVVRDGHPDSLYDNVGPPVWSTDSRRLLHMAQQGAHAFVVDNGVPGPHFDGVYTNCIVPIPNGSAFYGVIDGDSSFVVRDGIRVSRGYDGISGLIATPDGAHIAYVGLRGNRAIPVLDGVEGPGYPNFLHEIAFDPSGSKAAFAMLEPVGEDLGSFIEVFAKGQDSLRCLARLGPLHLGAAGAAPSSATPASPWSLLFNGDGSVLLFGLRQGPAEEILRWLGPIGTGAVYRCQGDSAMAIARATIPANSRAISALSDQGTPYWPAATPPALVTEDLKGFLTPFRLIPKGSVLVWNQLHEGALRRHTLEVHCSP